MAKSLLSDEMWLCKHGHDVGCKFSGRILILEQAVRELSEAWLASDPRLSDQTKKVLEDLDGLENSK